jgi:hypothetical protein
MGVYMINATAGHAQVDLPNEEPDKHEGVFKIRTSKKAIRIGTNDQFVSIVDNIQTDYNGEKIQLLNKGHIKKVTTEETKELTEGEMRDNELRVKRGKKRLKYYIAYFRLDSIDFQG